MNRKKAKAFLEKWFDDAREQNRRRAQPQPTQPAFDDDDDEDPGERAERLEAERERSVQERGQKADEALKKLRRSRRGLPPLDLGDPESVSLHLDAAELSLMRLAKKGLERHKRLQKRNARSPRSRALATKNRTAARHRNGTYRNMPRDPNTKKFVPWPRLP